MGHASTAQQPNSSLPIISDKGKAEVLISDGRLAHLNTFFALGRGLSLLEMIGFDVLDWNRLVIYAHVVEEHG